ncbi:alkaline phosphatase [Vibrio sp. WXL210]|uniref:alkaline phosphatase n=1 Tax=Vibrio sp. WXL210 TaxID=3450709 RepID=UPI003EC720A0
MKGNIFKLSSVALTVSALLITGCNSSNSNEEDKEVKQAKNIILMITDGASDGAWDIASYWQNGTLANDSVPYVDIETRYAMTTFPLNTSSSPADMCTDENGRPQVSYDKNQAWDDTPVEGSRRPFEGYEYLNKGYTDSAAAGTALSTGQKTYNNAIAVDFCGRDLKIISEYAKDQGMSTGVVSSVQFNHATPASFGAHHVSRNAYAELGSYMLQEGILDLIMGAGHPAFDGQGQERGTNNYNHKYISKEDWALLSDNELFAKGSELPWGMIDTKADFERLANNAASLDLMQAPLLGLVQNDSTLQQGRHCQEGEDRDVAFSCSMLNNVPTLEVMTKGALNYLSQNDNGFFVMIEGGAVDWAAHANHTARIIEEQIDFDDSVAAVMDWVEQNSSWDETMLIITTDHGNSYVLGEQSDQVAYAKVENPGIHAMPEVQYFSGDHTNELVRVYVKGVGEDMFEQHVVDTDSNYAEHYQNTGASGEFFDNTNIFDVMKEYIAK